MPDHTSDNDFTLLEEELTVLRRERNRLKAIIDEIPANVYWTDEDGAYLGVNRAQKDYCDKDPVGKDIYDVFDTDVKDRDSPSFGPAQDIFMLDERVRQSRKPAVSEEVGYSPGTKKRYFCVSHKKPLDLGDDKRGLIGVSIDITEQKKAQILLEKERKAALQASEAKTEFLFGLGHDILTPCMSMSQVCERLIAQEEAKEMEKNQKILDDLGLIHLSSNSLTDYVRHMLEYMRQDSHDKQISFFSVRELFEDAHALYQPKLVEKNLDFELVMDPSVPKRLPSDVFVLRKIIVNLLGNAIKYTEVGGITIRVGYAPGKRRSSFMFSVEDTGVGIARKDQARIFDSFVQLLDQKQGKREGIGLGLASVKKYLEKLSGKVKVKSKLGEGSCFIVSLPIDNRFLEKNTLKDARFYLAPQHKRVKARSLDSILIIDDDAISGHVLTRHLELYCRSIDFASDVQTALDRMMDKRYDFVFCDLNLPDGTGFDVMKHHEKILSFQTSDAEVIDPAIFVLLTSDYSPIKLHQAIDAGFAMVYHKPIKDTDIKDIMAFFGIKKPKYKRLTTKK